MRDTVRAFNDFVVRIVRSPRFFYAVVGLLVVQALWIALTARYPQAFDENYHFGLIKLHAEQWLPYFTHQPPGGDVYGAIVREPSYLFHYLLSLPYRVLSAISDSQTYHVLVLRIINIAVFVAGLFVYRKLFDELKVSPGLRNIALMVFVLLPVVPLLAAHINYDNLMFLLSGLLFVYVARYIQFMRGRKPNAPLIPVKTALVILLICAAGSIVKFAFAPIFLGAVIALVIATVFYYYLMRIKPKSLAGLFDISGGFKLLVLIFLTGVALALCFERYGVNLVQYGSPVPSCDKVLTIEDCQAYSPWARDHLFSQTYPRPAIQGYIVYPFVWFWRMMYETMFTITSRTYEPYTEVFYYAYSPLRVGFVAAWIGLAGGLVGAAVFWRRIRRNRPLTVLLAIIAFYTLILFVKNLGMYHHTGEAVAIHGRYLIPVYPVLLLALAIGWHGLLSWFKHGRYEAVVLVALTLLFLQGGGITPWLVRSTPDWYWQDNQAAIQANQAVKALVDRVVIH